MVGDNLEFIREILRTRVSNSMTLGIEALLGAASIVVLCTSLYVTGEPYLAALLMIGVPVIIWLCIKPSRIVYAQLTLCCCVGFLTNDLGLPSAISYATDALSLMGVFFAAINYSRMRGKIAWGTAPIWLLVFILIATTSAIVHGVQPILYIWATRNILRLFAFVFASAVLLSKQDLKYIERIILIVLAANVVLCTYQYFILRLHGDYVSGLFGRNAALNVHLVFVSLLAVFGFQGKHYKLGLSAAILLSCCYIAAIAELKFYFVELLLIIILVLLLQKPSLRNVIIASISVFLMLSFIEYLGQIYPIFAGYYSFGNILSVSSSSYTGGETLGRISAIGTIASLFMHGPVDVLLGLGFGSGQYSQFFSSSLYASFGSTYRWSWFGDATLFLETGTLGLIAYIFIFVAIMIHAWKVRKVTFVDGWILRCCCAFSAICILLLFYNASLIVEPACYLVAIFISTIFIIGKSDDETLRG